MDRTGETYETDGGRPRTPGAGGRPAAWGTTVVYRLAVCIACLLVLAARPLPALELGPINARSALYEPLDARIPIRDARSDDLEGLKVVLGSPAQFELAGIARLDHLDLLEFNVVERGDGGGYIHVRTEEPVIEPALTFLIDVDWPRGRTVRGYRLYLSAAASRATGAGPQPRAAEETQSEPRTGATRTLPASGENRYGPVRPAETLWSIATRLRPDSSVSVQRMMLALVEANPNAFVSGNINGLQAGVMLRIPDRDDIGSDEASAAIAEVQAHHSAWSEHRNRTPVSAAPDGTETEPGGRIEVVSPETAAGVTGREEGAEVEALRKELALSMEEAGTYRRENEELKLRLSEAEEHVRELDRLVVLKNEEIAALQADLKALSEAAPPPMPLPEGEPRPSPDAVETEAESTPAPPPTAEESKPVAAPDEAESTTVPVPAQAAGAEPAPVAEAEPKALPFGLGALPVNPVFLVGGAGLLLLLLGVLALLRRRRASAGEDDALEVAESSSPEEASSPEEGNLLHELEAVAADLADEPDVPPRRTARAGPVAVAAAGSAMVLDGGDKLESLPDDVARPGSEGLVEERTAALWRDEGDAGPGHMVAADTGADDDVSETIIDIDALTGDDSDLSMRDDEADEDFDVTDITDLAELADDLADDLEAVPEETYPDRSADDDVDHFDRFFGGDDEVTDDTGVPGFAPGTGDGGPFERTSEVPDDGRYDARLAMPDEQEPVDADAGTAGATEEGVAWSAGQAAERSADFVPDVDADIDDSGSRSQALLDESTDDGETEQFSLDEFGESEVQTKIDLAQVYMEMGDTDSARGFLEAVLAEGDAEQQEVAREMLSKLA